MAGLKRVVFVVLVLASGLAMAPAAARVTTGGDTSFIVVLDPGRDVATAAPRLAAQHGGHSPRVFESVLGGFQFVGPASAATGLARSPGVRAVVPDEQFSLVDVASWGFFRIDAEQSVNDAQGPYRGAGTRIAIIDSGVDTRHRDLAPNLDLANGYNCVTPGAPPEDDNGHGTHVAGIAAAAFNPDGYGIVGVAPEARILPLKAFDASGQGDTSWILCALDRLAAVTTTSPMPTALNMSFADTGGDSTCDDGTITDVLHEALCDVVTVGANQGVPVVPVAAAGNANVDAASTIPAAFHDVITVSALVDLDGAGGGTAGCEFIFATFAFECDDTLASFSNYGTVVDVAAPGVDIYSSVPGGHDVLSGTSMAAPHVTGVVALLLGENGTLATSGVRSLLLQTGECPDGSQAGSDASCSNQGQWQKTYGSIFDGAGQTEPDRDGTPEPVVNAARAARAADAAGDPWSAPPVDEPPTVTMTTPLDGAVLSGESLVVTGTAGDDKQLPQVTVYVDGTSIGTTTPAQNGSWSVTWSLTAVSEGPHTLRAVATDSIDQTTATANRTVTVDNVPDAPTVMHVGELSDSATVGKRWTATATVRIVDGSGTAVPNATVSVNFTSLASIAAKPGGGGGGGGGSTSGAIQCVTDTTGYCSVTTRPSTSSVRFTVTNVAKTGWTYDPTNNVDVDLATPATDIVVTKP